MFYRTLSPLGPLPCFPSLLFTITQSGASGIADHILPLGDLLLFVLTTKAWCLQSTKKTDAPTARQTNQLSEIAEFTTDIRYLEGKSNFVADALSRTNGILSNKAAASVSNISSVANDRHVFLQHLDMLQSSATISSVCFCPPYFCF